MSQYYIYAGWCSKSFLLINGTKIQNLPTQSDMNNGRVWVKRPGSPSDIITPAVFVDSISGYRYGYGGLVFDWLMQGFSPKMANYFKTTYFTESGAYTGKITVQTFNRETGDWESYQAIARWPNVKQDAELLLGGLHNLKISFVNAVIAPEGPDLDVTIGETGSWVLSANNTVNITIDNDGDDPTFANTTVIYELPIAVDYVSHVAINWTTVEYSVDGGTIYSASVPGDLGTITHLKYIRSDALAASASYEVIAVTLIARATGVDSYIATVSTSGDINSDNNSDTIVISINEAPTAVADPLYSMSVNTTLTILTTDPNDLLDNDTLGYPIASIISFGAGSLGGTVDDNAAGVGVAMGGGVLTVNADGSFDFVLPDTIATYTFDYKLSNAQGDDTATVTIDVTA